MNNSPTKEGRYVCVAESEAGISFKDILVVSEKEQVKRFPPIMPFKVKTVQPNVLIDIECQPRNADQFTRYRKFGYNI